MINIILIFRCYVGMNWSLQSLSVMCWCVVRGRKNPSYYGLPDRLRRARQRADMTRTTASLAAGLSNEAASQIEQRQRLPRIDTIERLAGTLSVSSAWLAFGEGDEVAGPAQSDSYTVGQRMVMARTKRGMNRKALGIAAQVAGQAIANIEVKGTLPRVDTLELIAKALDVKPGWLAFGIASKVGARESASL